MRSSMENTKRGDARIEETEERERERE